MSVLIKGMEMPKSCEECFAREHIEADTDHCAFDYCVFENWKLPITPLPLTEKELKSRPSFCPLVPVPPHGRLIDAGLFQKSIHEHDYEIIDLLNSRGTGMFTSGIDYAISAAPTIIEAEVDDES